MSIHTSIDLDELRSFVAVGETLSFVQAAERLHISASALTRRVQRLEAALGTALLVRNTREVALSAAGQRFVPRAREVLETLDTAVLDLRESERDRATHLTLAALPSVTAHLLPAIIRRFRTRSPSVHLRVIECGASAVVEKVRDRTADFGFSFRAGWETDLAFSRVADDAYCLIAPAGHILAARDVVRWSDLKPYAAITAGPASGNMMLLKEALRDVDWLSDTVYEIDHLTTSLGMVEAGLGISVVPRSSLPDGAEDRMVVRPLTDPDVGRTLGLFRRRNERLGSAARQFLATAVAPEAGS
jgi:DNA-binding transcriptional LysR family regulator